MRPINSEHWEKSYAVYKARLWFQCLSQEAGTFIFHFLLPPIYTNPICLSKCAATTKAHISILHNLWEIGYKLQKDNEQRDTSNPLWCSLMVVCDKPMSTLIYWFLLGQFLRTLYQLLFLKTAWEVVATVKCLPPPTLCKTDVEHRDCKQFWKCGPETNFNYCYNKSLAA